MNANAILSTAQGHFKKLLADTELTPVEVPEWETTFYYPASLSMARKERITKAQEGGGLGHFVQILIECACDEDGKRLFKGNHVNTLMRDVDSNVVARIAGEMASALVPDEDIAEKSETIQK